jgi:hypothetical protein
MGFYFNIPYGSWRGPRDTRQKHQLNILLNLPNSPSHLILHAPPLRPSLHQYRLLICNENVNETSAHCAITHSRSLLYREISNTDTLCTLFPPVFMVTRLVSWSRGFRSLRCGKYITKAHH